MNLPEIFTESFRKDLVVAYHCFQGQHIKLQPPRMSSEMQCPRCGNIQGWSCYVEPSLSDERVWFCATPSCVSADKRRKENRQVPGRQRDWKEFCKTHEIGDLYWETTLEKVQQPQLFMKKLLEFSEKPAGVLNITGKAGTGKTYAALGVIEYYTRTHSDARFYSSGRLAELWATRMADGTSYELQNALRNCGLLVLDDFAQGTCSEAYLKIVFEVLKTRMEWSNRGTILTTNLEVNDFFTVIGEALADRVRTQKFICTQGTSRRTL